MVEKTIDKLPCSAYNIKAFRHRNAAMARWSSGQDGGLSRRKREFDSPTGHHNNKSAPFLLEGCTFVLFTLKKLKKQRR